MSGDETSINSVPAMTASVLKCIEQGMIVSLMLSETNQSAASLFPVHVT